MAQEHTSGDSNQRRQQLLREHESLRNRLGEVAQSLSRANQSGSDNHRDTGERRTASSEVRELLAGLANAATLADALRSLISAAHTLLPDTHGTLWLRLSDDEQLTIAGGWDAEREWHRPYQLLGRDASPPQWLISGPENGAGALTRRYALDGFGLPLGELRLRAGETTPELTREIELVAHCASLALGGMALQNNLRNHSMRDPLTGLFTGPWEDLRTVK